MLSAKTRMTIGLTCISMSILLCAVFMGMLPDRRGAILDGRRRLGEAVAVNCSILVTRIDLTRIEAVLQTIVQRNDDLLSAAVRRSDGVVDVEVGNHTGNWRVMSGERSNDTQILVPLHAGSDTWGAVELRFRAMTETGIAGLLNNPVTRLVAFCGSLGFLVFLLYLRKMLQHLDPSQAVPKRVRSALDNLAEGLLVIDNKQRIVLANQAFATWVKTDAAKLVGRNVSSFDWIAEDDDSLDGLPWVQAIKDECQIAGAMLGMKTVDSEIRTLLVNATPVLGHDQKYRGVLISLGDVTQLEETKVELQNSKLEAEQANTAKSQFLARMSHEIRTPMNAILGYTEVLRRGFDQDLNDRREYLDTIHGSGEHLLALINDILDLSKIESGRMELAFERSSPFQIITQVISVLNGRAKEKGVLLEFEVEGKLPETILTDSVRLKQAIMNLVGNAIKFTDQGVVRIVSRIGAIEQQPTLEIEVHDTGIGIAQESIDKIFNPFAQADSSITRRFGGTGLGLAISRQLAESLGGDLHVTSQLGQGSTFTITIDAGPLDDVRLLTKAEFKSEIQMGIQRSNSQVTLPSSRILVVDDGDSNRKLMNLVLSRAGATVVLAENGKEALELALRQPYDAILMDMQMPVMDGYTAATKLRDAGYALPIIALTAHAMQGDKEKCLSAGCSGFMTKPIDIDLLLHTLAELLHDKQPSESVDETRLADSPNKQETNLGDHAPKNQVADHPIVSTLPMDDEGFREIVVEFMERLNAKLNEMRNAAADGDLDAVALLAHWLKGSGGTAGIDEFTEPARTLEQLAKNGQQNELGPTIDKLKSIADRVVIPNCETQYESNASSSCAT